jgi:hypothetical protein
VATNTVSAINTAVQGDFMPIHIAMAELRDSSRVTGIGTNITDEDIENAKQADPPPFTENDDHDQAGFEANTNRLRNTATQDSQSRGRHRKWYLRWF